MKFLNRLFPQRLQAAPPPTHEERRQWLANVGENDPCLKAHLDIQQEIMIREFYVAIDPKRTDVEVLRAVQGMRVAFYALNQLEGERAEAMKWKDAQQQQ